MLRAIFGEKAADVKDTSLKVPSGTYGIVMDVKVSSKKDGERTTKSASSEEKRHAKQIEDDHKKKVDELSDQLTEALSNILLGEKNSARRGEFRDRRNHHPGEPQDH